ncbi:hypothetical protein CSHISOI_08613 [Colletotrichum shisoi]|uniref:Uncharacterized protein n=1 Tax=Colletotrichum shisoi TaxID=2078593 RepID=A0A5Q4BIQ6_9PEZI|nr:hypothetical protein CSHISOI_08613 [Colletotrichum shisoi]
MQTDDTIGLGDGPFDELEDKELKNAGLLAKPKGYLSTANPLMFNGGIVSIANDGKVALKQKGQGLKLETIDPKSVTAIGDYVRQRARGAYIATVCQPEASFDLSTAAQHQHPGQEEIAALNRRLEWQKRSIRLEHYPVTDQLKRWNAREDTSFCLHNLHKGGFAIRAGIFETFAAGETRRWSWNARLIGKDLVVYDTLPRPDVTPTPRMQDALRMHKRHLLADPNNRNTTAAGL